MPRSPSRDARSRGRTGRTFVGSSGGGGGGFNPATLTGVLHWYRGKDLGSSGSNITTWPDQSGLSRDLTTHLGTAPTVATTTPTSGKCANFTAGSLWNTSALRTTGDDAYATATSQFNTGYRPSSVLNNSGNWASANSTMPNTWTVKLNTAKTVTGYSIQIPTSARGPKDWTFDGSNNGSSWTTLDTRTNSAASFTGSPLVGSFTFSNSTAYLYYRIVVTAANSGGTDILYFNRVNLTGATLGGTQPSAIETWIVVKQSGAANSGFPIYTSQIGLAANGAATLYPYSGDSKVYDDYSQAALRISFTPSVAVSSWRLLRIVHTGTARTWYLNNVQQFTESRAAPATGELWVGRGGADLFTGAIAEIFTRSQVSTSGEITSLIAYFNAEHGLTVT